MSKNLTDFNHTNYDEGILVYGPAASISMNAYRRDLELAVERAIKQKKIDSSGLQQVESWLNLDSQATSRSSTLHVAGRGTAQVRIAQNNADDSVRNLEHNILKLIAGAGKNIRIYNLFSYHPTIAKGIADASKRLGAKNVRILLDSSMAYKPNNLFVAMLQKEMLYDANEEKSNYSIERMRAVHLDESVRWRKLLPPKHQNHLGFIDIAQQQHVKSIIIDDDKLLIGSANFDVNTLKGAFREFSLIVKEPQAAGVASESADIFDKLWKSEIDSAKSEDMKQAQKLLGIVPPSENLQFEATKIIEMEHTRNEGMNPRNLELQDSAGNWKQDCY